MEMLCFLFNGKEATETLSFYEIKLCILYKLSNKKQAAPVKYFTIF